MKQLSVYVHIPFCAKKCAYCDFNSVALKNRRTTRRYVDSLLGEIEHEALRHAKGYCVDTIYFGGGTPSVIAPEDIARILHVIRGSCDVSKKAEITIEVNPGTVASRMLGTYRKLGINRLSIGSQSFIDSELQLLGRIHTAKEIASAFTAAREAGFTNISLDLIFGLPDQAENSVACSLAEILRLKPEHVSTYSLTIEKGTPLARSIAQKKLPLPDQEVQADMFRGIIRTLSAHGYRHYEISNFAKHGYESRHNQAYWTGKEYIGFGAGAHSYMDGVRYANTKDVAGYLTHNRKKKFRILTAEERSWEHIVLGLRMLKGIAVTNGAIPRKALLKKIEPLIDQGLLEYRDGQLKLTDTGVFFYDTVAVELL